MLPTDFNASINDKSGVRDPFGGGMSGFSKRHGSKVKIVEIFSMDRDGEIAAFEAHGAKGNRTLLWHGTNIAVAAAICSSGMRIMPNSGGRVGQGIYLVSAATVAPSHLSTAVADAQPFLPTVSLKQLNFTPAQASDALMA